MKKSISIILIVLILTMEACSMQGNIPAKAEDDTLPEYITVLNEGIWPVNDYTEGLPEPSGTVMWAMLDSQHMNCSINLTNMNQNAYNSYLDLLKQAGYSVVEDVAEEIKGQDYVSIGALMSNGERWLSISYIPDSFTIYISFEKLM